MKYFILIQKAVPAPVDNNHKRGEVRNTTALKRIVTGVDKDGSPQYRYIRTQEALDAWEENQKKNKPKDGKKDKPDLKEKVGKEHKDSTEKVKDKDKDKTEKCLFVSKKAK